MNVAAAGRRSQNCSGLRVGVDAFQELPNGRQAGSAGLEGGQVETAPPRERLLHLEQVLGAHAVGDERRLGGGEAGEGEEAGRQAPAAAWAPAPGRAGGRGILLDGGRPVGVPSGNRLGLWGDGAISFAGRVGQLIDE